MPKNDSKTFKINTIHFIDLWSDCLNNDHTWAAFVHSIYASKIIQNDNDFKDIFEANGFWVKGTDILAHMDPGMIISDKSRIQYQSIFHFVSEKAYSKCNSLRKKLGEGKTENGPDLPRGFDERPGTKAGRMKINWNDQRKKFQ